MHRPIDRCLCCDAPTLRGVLDFGLQPPANAYAATAAAAAGVPRHPLALNLCATCWHAQLSFAVDRRELFAHYAYVSGTSRTLTRFFDWFAAALARALPPRARVLEIAANDGSLVRSMQAAGLNCTGIDPAANIVAGARAAGLPVRLGWWPAAAAELDDLYDAVVCMNVLAHVDDPLAFLQACASRLAPGGVVIVQPSQARMFDNGEFDTVYHEHVSFFNTRSIAHLAQRAGLRLAGSAIVQVHGDSPVYLLRHAHEAGAADALARSLREGEFGLDEDLQAYEQRVGLFGPEVYDRFRERAAAVMDRARAVVDEHRSGGFEIVFVGAAAKALTLINAAGIVPDRLLDESPLKIGTHAPGCACLVEPLQAAGAIARPALFVLSAWNFRHELTRKLRDIGVPEGSRFHAYLPEPAFL
jgi:SAM-dependent methyltransferase